MFDEALKWVGPFPLLQLVGSVLILYLAVKSGMAGMRNTSAEPTSNAVTHEIELPDWFLDDCKEQQKNIQRTLWVVEDINNKIEMMRGIATKSIPPVG